MSGPTEDQTQLTDEETAAYKQAQQMTAEQYGQQEAIYGPMSAQFQKIFNAGPNQTGFSKAETDTLNAQALEGTAENYKGAAKALGDAESSEGGGNSPLEGGAEQEQKENLAESSAGEESKEETGITEANFQQGQTNWANAAQGLTTIATGENPVGFENAESSTGQVANTEANTVAEEGNEWVNAALGAAGSIGADFACPAKGAIITMATGALRTVEKLKAGDIILGYNGPEKILSIKPVKSKILGVTLENGMTARCSPSHAFILEVTKTIRNLQTVDATLAKGSVVLINRGAPSRVANVKKEKMDIVYNIITEGLHTYCADGIWCVGDEA